GLFETARQFTPPTAAELERAGTDFPERAKVPAFVETMVRVDQHWDRLKAVQRAGLKAPPEHPDVDPPHEALLLTELFREASRLAEARAKGEDFVRKLDAAEKQAATLGRALRGFAERPEEASRRASEGAFLGLSKGCTGCHARYRDN